MFCTIITIALILYSFINFDKTQQENHPPVVKIISPLNRSSFDKNDQITYKISVSDKEDGDSKFDEINPKEVLLEVRYMKNGKTPAPLAKTQNNAGLNSIMISNCVNCHNFNSKAMGPSFYEINKRYPAAIRSNMDTLIKYIKEGSTGVWGKEKMPAHPELASAEIKSIVQWIMKSAADPNVNYYIGTSGYFQIKVPVTQKDKSSYQLTASYTDHGLIDVPGKRLTGQDAILIERK